MRRIRRGLSRYGNPLRRGLSESRGRYLLENSGIIQKESFSSVREILNQGISLDNGGFDFENCKFDSVEFVRSYKGKVLRFMAKNTDFFSCDFGTKIVEIDGADGGNLFKYCRFNNSTFTKETYFYKCTFDECWFQNVNFKSNRINFEKCKFINRHLDARWANTLLGDTRKNFKNCTMNGWDFDSEMRDDL